VKIARISAVIIPDRQRPSELYHDDTMTILELMFCRYQAMQDLLGIVWYCQELESIVKVLLGITKYCQLSQSILRYCQELPS
jgi:hypothetical protein